MQKLKETFRCALKIISPVHLGCDEVYEPTGFVIDEEKGHLTAFDPIVFIKSLPADDREKLSGICRKGSVESVLEVYKFFKGKKADGRRVELCNGFADHYRKVLALSANRKVVTQNLNQFQISRTAFKSTDNRPYIPGSAIKGAIRTAYLNALAGEKRVPKQKYANELQSKLIGYDSRKMETDPFRLVKVSDFMPVGGIRTRIVYAINKKKKVSDREARGPYQILEVIESGACFTGEISVERPQSGRFISHPVTLEAVLQSLNPFYQGENQRECRELGNIKVEGVAVKPVTGAHVLRIGRHSGAESITVNGHRNIRIMLGGSKKPVFKKNATTFWLASETDKNTYNQGLRPFGWTVMEPMSSENERQLLAEEEAYTYQEMLVKQKRLDDAAEKKEQAIREKQEAERLQREKEDAEQREKERQAALEAMSPEERLLIKFEEGSIREEEANIAYKQIDEFPEDLKSSLSAKLKAYWIANKKWSKKDVGKKKWKVVRERNQKIDGIIGE